VWTPGTPRDAPFGAGKHGFETAGGRFNGFSQNVSRMVNGGQSVKDAKQVLYDEVSANFESFLKARPTDKPFCYWFGPTLVHRKWIQGSGKKLWGIDPDSLKGKLPGMLPDVPIVREDFADYLGEVQAFDHALGLILKRLEQLGELDNTVVVVSGDHGAPGFPGGKCNLYDFGTAVPLAVWWPGKPGGRVLKDYVNLMDLAPTFLELGGVKPPKVMTGRSLVPVLESKQQGLVDAERNWVITGRERHVARARADLLGYPQRALRTPEFLYIINFKPDRWPMGDPYHLKADKQPDFNTLANNTFVTFGDLDASPTKAWLMQQVDVPKWKWHYDYAFGRRPRIELYDLKNDPDQLKNVAGQPQFAAAQKQLHTRLMAELKRTGDPRVSGDGSTFDKPPFVSDFGRRPAQAMSVETQAQAGPEGDGFFRLSETDKTFELRWRSGSLKYQDFKLISEGGIAKLYTAFDENLRRTVVYKTLHDHLREDEIETQRFLREARVTANIAHPGTVPLYELGRDRNGNLFFHDETRARS
jgi:arylsulfatase A-like enzyme